MASILEVVQRIFSILLRFILNLPHHATKRVASINIGVAAKRNRLLTLIVEISTVRPL